MHPYRNRKFENIRKLGETLDLIAQVALVIVANTVSKSRFGCVIASLVCSIASFVCIYLHVERMYKFDERDYWALLFVADFIDIALYIVFVCIWSLTDSKSHALAVFIAYTAADIITMLVKLIYHVHEAADETKWRWKALHFYSLVIRIITIVTTLHAILVNMKITK